MLDQNIPQPWQGQTTLVLALAAAAIGLGNAFRFPFLLGEHGGAPFFIAYVLTLFLVVAPMLAAEVMLGSNGRGSPVAALRWAGDQSGRSVYWSWLGLLQSIVALLLASQLLVFAVLALDRAQVVSEGALAAASAVDIARDFERAVGDRTGLGAIGLAVIAAATALVSLGPKYAMGIIGWLGVPAMAVAGFGLADFALARGDLSAASEVLFARNYDDFGFDGAMAGMLSALFTAGAGLGVGLCFGARAPRGLPLLRAVAAAIVIDAAFSILLAVALIPLLLATNIEPTEGVALLFIAVPYAYVNLPAGDVYGVVFFGFLFIAFFFAMVALMEPATLFLRKDRSMPRFVAAPLVAAAVVITALITRSAIDTAGTVIGLADAGVLLGLLGLAIFVGWRMPRPIVRGELYSEPRWLFLLWWELVRLLVPVVLVLGLFWIAVTPL